MLSKITMVLAFAMAIITVVPASVGTSFARDSGRSAQASGDGYYYQNGTLYYRGYPSCQWGEATC
jgi:hypothetical protein